MICLRTGAIKRWPCRLLDGAGRRLTAVAPTNTAPTEAAQCGREELGDVSFDAGSRAGHVWEVAIAVGWRRLFGFRVGHAVTRDPPVRRGGSGGVRPWALSVGGAETRSPGQRLSAVTCPSLSVDPELVQH